MTWWNHPPRAGRRHLENCAEVTRAPGKGCAVEVAITTLHQTGIGKTSFVSRVSDVLRARGGEAENLFINLRLDCRDKNALEKTNSGDRAKSKRCSEPRPHAQRRTSDIDVWQRHYWELASILTNPVASNKAIIKINT